ncbi:hypothetical protein WJX81_001474 [Elliptochloris bilobata]|uniref:Uncharacterized protein n=1 Tax=Elliptochloris bilobata TaxID=381761 RepID=A0AAW1RA91_9CHLO
MDRDAALGGAFSAPMGFDALEYEAGVLRDQAESMAEYAALKQQLLRRTQRAGAALAAYLLLTVSGETALAELVGCAASCGYLALLMREVDAVTPDTRVPLAAAERVAQQPARVLALAFAAYRQALRPRLLVLAALAAAVYEYDMYAAAPLSSGMKLALFGGFLSYKAALLLTLWDDIKPRSAGAGLRPAPPLLAALPDPAQALAAEARAQAAPDDSDDDGVVLTEDAQRAVDSILRRESRSVLKRLPQN